MRTDVFRIDWRHAAGEATLIVFSVFLALWVTAAREAYQDRSKERRYLSALATEFSKTSADLAETRRWLQHTQQVARELIELNRRPIQNVPRDSVGRLLREFGGTRFFTPTVAAYQDLKNSGSLNLLRSEGLRLGLASFDQAVEVNNVYQRNLHQFFLESWDPFLRARIPLLALGFADVPEGEFKLRPENLLHTQEFENLLAARIGFGADVEQSTQRLEETVDRVLMILRSFDMRTN